MTIPLKALFDGPDLIGLGEFTAADTVPLTQGGTGATTAAGARTALGLGSAATQDSTAFQPVDSDLTALAGLSTTGLIERTGTGTAQTVTVTTAGKALLDDADASAQRTTLGLGGAATLSVGTTAGTVCAGNDSRLSDARTPTAHSTGSHSDWPAAVSMTEVGYLDGVTSAIQAQLDGKSATGHTHSYQPLDTELTALAGLTSAADRLPYFTGSGTASLATFTAAARALLDDADAAAMRATLGLGSAATTAATAYATAAQGTNADSAQQPNVAASFAETVITASGSTAALRVTQTGAGDALRVEDSANPDSSPFVIDATGKLILGAASTTETAVSSSCQLFSSSAYLPQFSLINQSDTGAPYVMFHKRYSPGDIPPANSVTGTIAWFTHDSSTWGYAAGINVAVDGPAAIGSTPGRLVFSTTPSGQITLSERARINSSGNVGIGFTDPSARLHVVSTTEQLRIGYDATRYASFTVGSTGTLTITPTGGLVLVQSEYSIGNLGASYQVTLTNGTKQRGTLNASCTISLATPSGACTIRLRLVNSGAGNTISVSGVRWVGGTAPTFDTADAHENILVFDYGSTGWVADGGPI